MLVVVNQKVSFYTTAGALRDQVGDRMDLNLACRKLMAILDDDRKTSAKYAMETVGIGRPVDDFHINISIVKGY